MVNQDAITSTIKDACNNMSFFSLCHTPSVHYYDPITTIIIRTLKRCCWIELKTLEGEYKAHNPIYNESVMIVTTMGFVSNRWAKAVSPFLQNAKQ
jgi:hypothetical protein